MILTYKMTLEIELNSPDRKPTAKFSTFQFVAISDERAEKIADMIFSRWKHRCKGYDLARVIKKFRK